MPASAYAIHQFTITKGGARLDACLARMLPDLTRSQLHRLIDQGLVTVNGAPAKPAQKTRSGDSVTVTVPPPQPLEAQPQDIPLTVVHQDAALIVVDKPAGLPTHPGPGHPDQTLVNALLALCPDIQGVGGAIRPGIVHRLDKDTSGLMVVAKTHAAHLSLSEQIKERQTRKGYLAVATGHVSSAAGVIDAPIDRHPVHRQKMAVVEGGRPARTRYRVLELLGAPRQGRTYLELYLETGRTHQIRVHLAHLGHPLLGDAVYGKGSPLLSRHFLHAFCLGFRHPDTGEWMEFRSELPPDLAEALRRLRG